MTPHPFSKKYFSFPQKAQNGFILGVKGQKFLFCYKSNFFFNSLAAEISKKWPKITHARTMVHTVSTFQAHRSLMEVPPGVNLGICQYFQNITEKVLFLLKPGVTGHWHLWEAPRMHWNMGFPGTWYNPYLLWYRPQGYHTWYGVRVGGVPQEHPPSVVRSWKIISV